MRHVLLIFLVAFVLAARANAFAEPAALPIPTVWKVSAIAIAIAGASALDAASSWGKCCESNRLLASPDRRFGARGATIKAAALGSQLLVQYFVGRKSPRLARVLSVINFAGAGALTAVAVRNYGIPQPGAR